MNFNKAWEILLIECYKIFRSNNYDFRTVIDSSEIRKRKNIPDEMYKTAIENLKDKPYISILRSGEEKIFLTSFGVTAAENLIKERRRLWKERGWTLLIVIVGTFLASYIYVHIGSLINWFKRILHLN